MSGRTTSKKDHNRRIEREPRAQRHVEDYQQLVDETLAWFAMHSVGATKIESKEYPDTGGTQWSVTVVVGHRHSKMSDMGLALKYMSYAFPGMYNHRIWEDRNAAEPTYTFSWFTNEQTE